MKVGMKVQMISDRFHEEGSPQTSWVGLTGEIVNLRSSRIKGYMVVRFKTTDVPDYELFCDEPHPPTLDFPVAPSEVTPI